MPRTIVVVPCFNEAQRLNLRAIQEFGRRSEAELLFVNDGSRDETLDLLAHLHAVNPRRFTLLDLAQNGGKAEAVRQGILAAIRSGAEYVGFWDADLATPLADIERFAAVLDSRPQIELVIGTRMRLLGHAIERKRSRYLLGRLFAAAASLALGMRVFDTQCGAKLIRVTPAVAAAFSRPFLSRWIFDVEIMARLRSARRAAGLDDVSRAIYELPLDAWRDVAGSTVKGRDFARAAIELVRIYWTYLRPGAGYEAIAPLDPPVVVEGRGDQKAA